MSRDNISASGHLIIYKVFEDGREEVAFDDHNVITSGMGVGLATLFAGSGSDNIGDFQIRWFQLGTEGDTVLDTFDYTQTFLVSALGQDNGAADYGDKLILDEHEIATADGSDGGDLYFAQIPYNAIKKTSPTTVTFILYIDRDTANGITINEVGLFMNNPLVGFKSTIIRSILVAYRPFVDIAKTNDFSLAFKWTITF